jgi:hypothetical protein
MSRKDFRVGRSGEKSFSGCSTQRVKLMERDPGVEYPVWIHGPASQFVVAQRFMEARAKAAGVFDIWTGEEKTELGYPKPTISYILDSTYADTHVREDSEEGRAMITTSRGSPESGGTPAVRTVAVYRSPGGLISLEVPRYHPSEGEREEFSGLEFGRLVQRTNSFEKYTYATSKTREQTMKWEEATTYKRKRVALAEAVLSGCLGASANAVVKPYLRRGDISDAWEALQTKYARPGDADVIRQLRTHMRSLEMSPVRLEEFLNQMDILRDALEQCGATVEESECLSIIEGAVLATTAGKKIYGPAFVNARHSGWGTDELIDALSSNCHELIQAEGIAAIKIAEFQRELLRRKIVPKQNDGGGADGNKTEVGPSANAPTAPTAGTDGTTLANMVCYRCGLTGHIARHCPEKKGAGAVVANPKVPKAAAKAAEADTEEEKEEEDLPQATAPSRRPPRMSPARAAPTPACSSTGPNLRTPTGAARGTPTCHSPRR